MGLHPRHSLQQTLHLWEAGFLCKVDNLVSSKIAVQRSGYYLVKDQGVHGIALAHDNDGARHTLPLSCMLSLGLLTL